jgi:hypothetical protein
MAKRGRKSKMNKPQNTPTNILKEEKKVVEPIEDVKNVSTEPVEDSKIVESLEEVVTEPVEDTSENVAIVKNEGTIEIRKYTREVHGEEFAKMAQEFAKRRNYTVELRYVDKRDVCQNCGHVRK